MEKEKVYIPPIKIQGIKTKLVPLVKQQVCIYQNTRWIEPFLGSGVVGFNVAPYHAIFADTNPHIINFYNQIKDGEISACIVRNYLEQEGELLEKQDEAYYYFVRERFNSTHEPLDFLFLNRACFNGMIRFNKDYKFNVPYGHKRFRFAKAYITKIVNQVGHLEQIFAKNDWMFICQSFEKTIAEAKSSDFIYCDPPYIGRHVDYYDSWDEASEIKLRDCLLNSKAKFMLSTWDYNQYRKNSYIEQVWGMCHKINKQHFYHVGAKEINRRPIMEALLVNYEVNGAKSKTFGKDSGLYDRI